MATYVSSVKERTATTSALLVRFRARLRWAIQGRLTVMSNISTCSIWGIVLGRYSRLADARSAPYDFLPLRHLLYFLLGSHHFSPDLRFLFLSFHPLLFDRLHLLLGLLPVFLCMLPLLVGFGTLLHFSRFHDVLECHNFVAYLSLLCMFSCFLLIVLLHWCIILVFEKLAFCEGPLCSIENLLQILVHMRNIFGPFLKLTLECRKTNSVGWCFQRSRRQRRLCGYSGCDFCGGWIDGSLLHTIKNFSRVERENSRLGPSRSDVPRSQSDIVGSAV